MARTKFIWRCQQKGCPRPDYPKNFNAQACRSARGPAASKAMVHGYKYHYQKVTVQWKGGPLVIRRNKTTGLFECPCGQATHARRDSQRLLSLCSLKSHPRPGEAVAHQDTTDSSDDEHEDDCDASDDDHEVARRERTMRDDISAIEISSSSSTPASAPVRSLRSASSPSGRVNATARSSTIRVSAAETPSDFANRIRRRSPDSDSESDPEILELRLELREVKELEKAMLRRQIASRMKRARLD
ncbi:hypothetical protein BD626DRAFT_568798 [Schizophyllum amplum]|uniref:Uncharacterized protein n=1 Tax=Schizophyllum amplum TaxID=97359 RepID=A0A550CF07_9AGAR|nr:hypothetical protein BD626DRAFT_568798 [Auriculariopsis ampla]